VKMRGLPLCALCISVPSVFQTTSRSTIAVAMRKDLLDILACPMDKAPLELTADQENGDEVIQGSLKCTQCAEVYPIEDRIPNLLPPDMRKATEAKAEAE
jgi:uncharacterized protein YbaR (Trm112 family)